MEADEIALESLEVEFGERLLGTDGLPAPFAGREITAEDAAEILGIGLVLLERWMKTGILPYRESQGKFTLNLVQVVELKRKEDARDSR